MVYLQQALHDQLANDGAPLNFRKLSADAEGAEPFMTVVADAWRGLAPQHIDEMLRTKTHAAGLPDPVDAGQQHLRGAGAIPLGGRFQTVIAVPARRGSLSKVIQQAHPPTAHALAQSNHGIKLRRAHTPVGLRRVRLLDHAPQLHDV
ncbi:MAG: hypothetical protein WDM77_19815 [Steroidobacteraceae bacterium]